MIICLITISRAILTQSFFIHILHINIYICMSVTSCIFSVQERSCFDTVPFSLLRTVYQHLFYASHLRNPFLFDTVS